MQRHTRLGLLTRTSYRPMSPSSPGQPTLTGTGFQTCTSLSTARLVACFLSPRALEACTARSALGSPSPVRSATLQTRRCSSPTHPSCRRPGDPIARLLMSASCLETPLTMPCFGAVRTRMLLVSLLQHRWHRAVRRTLWRLVLCTSAALSTHICGYCSHAMEPFNSSWWNRHVLNASSAGLHASALDAVE